MIVNTFITSSLDATGVVASPGDYVSTDYRTIGKGYAVVECSGAGSIDVIVYGKAVKSSDATVDSGWVQVGDFPVVAAGTAAGLEVDVFPNMSFQLSGNTIGDNASITLSHSISK
jgi:hypothetical protein